MPQTLSWREATAAVNDDKSITNMLMNGDHHIMLQQRLLSTSDIIISISIQLNNQYDRRHFRSHSALIHTHIIIQSSQKWDPRMEVVLPLIPFLHIGTIQARKYQ